MVESTSLGLVTYDFRYVTDTPSRARYEAEAYRSAFELNWWHSKTVPSPQKVANLLTGYGCTAMDVAMAETILAVTAKEVELGAILNLATSVALGWLNVHAAYLRALGLSEVYLDTKCLCYRCVTYNTSSKTQTPAE